MSSNPPHHATVAPWPGPSPAPWPQPPTRPRIVGLATAVPGEAVDQQTVFDTVYRQAFGGVPGAERLFCEAGVERRHGFHDPRTDARATALSTGERMRIWKAGAMALGRDAVGRLLAQGVDRDSVGHFVMASCTGYDTPSPDILLAKEFGLPKTLRRSFLGHVGCHAGLTALRTGVDALAARPGAATALVHCTEISSAHVRTTDHSLEQVLCQALFADASAALALSVEEGRPGPEVLGTHTETLYAGSDHMGWSIGDDGFKMRLSPLLPFAIGGEVAGFTRRLLAPLGLRTNDVHCWGVHPGGPRILDAVERALSLPQDALDPSRRVLAAHGNCSSATIFLVLERLLAAAPPPGAFGVLLAFGPGLTFEGTVLRF